MTDKEIAEKKSEFFKRFVDVFEYEEDWNDGVSFRITASINEVWDFIEKLVEEVEEEGNRKLMALARKVKPTRYYDGISEAEGQGIASDIINNY